jgi:hydrogenase expression/formation protein HypE
MNKKSSNSKILLGHGSGGKLSAELIKDLFLPAFDNEILRQLGDQAVVTINGTKLAFTTDSYVVNPIFFPGGSIGSVAVNGTINDLAVGGARPLYISAGMIIEEGFGMEDLERIVGDMKTACRRAGVQLVTGDTKVVEKGKGDKIFINTSGIGIIDDAVSLSPSEVRQGDKIIVSGPIGLHGITIMSVREGLEFETAIESDTRPLHELVGVMLDTGASVRWMRDPTRGGISSSLNELAQSSGLGIELDEKSIPVPGPVHAACEMLGLDPLYVANEGILLAVVASEGSDTVLEAMRQNPAGTHATLIGEVTKEHPGYVLLKTQIGGKRIVDMLAGEQLPRIC